MDAGDDKAIIMTVYLPELTFFSFKNFVKLFPAFN